MRKSLAFCLRRMAQRLDPKPPTITQTNIFCSPPTTMASAADFTFRLTGSH